MSPRPNVPLATTRRPSRLDPERCATARHSLAGHRAPLPRWLPRRSSTTRLFPASCHAKQLRCTPPDLCLAAPAAGHRASPLLKPPRGAPTRTAHSRPSCSDYALHTCGPPCGVMLPTAMSPTNADKSSPEPHSHRPQSVLSGYFTFQSFIFVYFIINNIGLVLKV